MSQEVQIFLAGALGLLAGCLIIGLLLWPSCQFGRAIREGKYLLEELGYENVRWEGRNFKGRHIFWCEYDQLQSSVVLSASRRYKRGANFTYDFSSREVAVYAGAPQDAEVVINPTVNELIARDIEDHVLKAKAEA